MDDRLDKLLSDISQAEVRSDPKKGDFYVAVIETPGRDATDIIAEAVPAIIRGFHWPKSMRWGTGELRFALLCCDSAAIARVRNRTNREV